MTSIKRLLVLSLAVLGTLVVAQPANAAPAINGEFPLTAQPEHITAGPDGNMWVTLSGSAAGDDLAKVDPNGAVTYYDLDTAPSPGGIVADPDGLHLWATIATGVVKIPIADPTTETATAIAAFVDARGITVGPDGNLWAASGDKVIKIPPANPAAFTAYPVAGMAAREIRAGTDGRLWVVDNGGGRIIAMNTDGTFTPHTVGGNPQGIAAGPGGQVLYTNPGTNPHTVGLLSFGGTPLTRDVPVTDPSFSATFGLDEAYWVGLFLTRELARVTPAGELTTLGTFTAPLKPRYLSAGPGGTIWVSLQDPGNNGAIGRVTGLEAPVIDDPDDTPADDTASIEILGKKIKLKESGAAKVRLACPADEANGPCSGRVKLKSKKLGGLAKARYEIAAGTIEKVKLKVKNDRDLERLLADENGSKVKVIATVADALGNGAKATDKQKLKPAG